MAYSVDFRKKVVEYLERGNTQRSAAEVFEIHLETVNKWSQQYQKTGELIDKPPKRYFKKIDPEKLQAYVEKHPDAYLKEIAEAFGCSDTAIHKALLRLDITRKKRRSGIKSRIPNE